MLFRNKKNDEKARRKEEFSRRLKQLEETLSGYGAQMSGMEERLTQQMRASGEENAKTIRRQSASLEDILEELQRQGEEKSGISERLSELKERESSLAGLCFLLMGQKEMILSHLLEEGTLPEDVRSGWLRQARLMDQESEKLERQCAIQRLGRCGEKVDYDFHEILSVIPTSRKEEQGTVARVFAGGYVYQGHVMKKAQVAVYRYEEPDTPRREEEEDTGSGYTPRWEEEQEEKVEHDPDSCPIE